MKRLLVAAVFVVVGTGSTYGQPDFADGTSVYDTPVPPRNLRFPVKDDATAIRRALRDTEASDYSVLSVEGVVKTLKLNARGQPIYEIQSEGGDVPSLWAIWATQLRTGSFLQVGARVRVLGWLAKTGDWQSIIGSELPPERPLFLLSICLVQVPTLDAIIDKKYVRYCDGWERGILPPPMKSLK